MATNHEISRMLEIRRRGEDPKAEFQEMRVKRNSKSSENEIVCKNCSAQNPVNAAFCQKCGQKMVQKDEIMSNKNKSTKSSSKKNHGGFFAPEKKGIEMGVTGGIAMMAIAVIWFLGGLAIDIIFFYPAILFIIGLYAFFKGLLTGNLSGGK